MFQLSFLNHSTFGIFYREQTDHGIRENCAYRIRGDAHGKRYQRWND
jgi:hypothetical protein